MTTDVTPGQDATSARMLRAPRFPSALSATLVSQVAGWLAAAIGAMVLMGWAIGDERLTSISPRYIAMLPNTATGMLAGGIAILLLRASTSPAVTAARVLASLVFVLGLLSFASRLLGQELAWVGHLFYDRVAEHPYRPVGLMATNSTIVFMLTGMSLLLISTSDQALRRWARTLAMMGGALAAVALLGHVFQAPALYAFDRAAGMALLTAIAFIALQVGVLFLYPEDPGVSLVTGNDLAARVTRRLLPLTVILPILAGLLWLEGREEQWYSRETGIALYIVLSTVWLIMLSLYNAGLIREADAARAALLEREQQARAAAEQASKAKSDFLAVMSHELRTPLNAITGYASLLEQGVSGSLNAVQASQLARIRGAAQHLTSVVDEILTLTRADAGVTSVELERVRVEDLLRPVCEIVEPLARARGLSFTLDSDADLIVLTDPHRVKQILINLGGNAVKFTRAGEVRLRCRRDGEVARVEVIDTGIGVAPDHLERIFEDFWQVEGALTRSTGGAGLGLAVSRKLARALGTDISVTSTVGAGSTFSLDLPVAVEPRPTRDPAPDGPGSLTSQRELPDTPPARPAVSSPDT